MTDLGAQGLQGNGVFEALPAGLKPEFSDNVDLGFRLRGRGMWFESTVFRSSIRNLIVARTLLLPPGAAGQIISGERITSQRADGAVFVAISTQPVQVRSNQDRGVFRGLEQRFEAKVASAWTLAQGFTWLRADDPESGRVPNVEGAYPPPMGYVRLRYNPSGRRFWIEPYWTGNARLNRLSELALNDRRVGANRTRAQITNFYNNNPALAAITGLSLEGVLARVNTGPLFRSLPGYGILGVRGGYTFHDRLSLFADFGNLADKNHRGMTWGVDGAGRGVSLQLRWNL
jgi:hemoglobin/transferrin/lactoferrin receptor protein